LRDRFGARPAVDVGDGDVRPLFREYFRDAAADAASRSRDQRDFAFEFQDALRKL
jgi:hypothetical protein